MSVVAAPRPVALKRRGLRVWTILAVVAALILAVVLFFAFSGGKAKSSLVAQSYQVIPLDMEIKVSKDGEVFAIDNVDINCQVEGTSTIQTIVKEGTFVKKGDTLLTLDSTNIRQRLEDTSVEVQKAEADVANAREMFEIQKNTNDTNLESSTVQLTLTGLELKQYVEGTYPQQLTNAQTEVKMARITLDNRLEDLEQTKKLYSRNFVTAADVKKAELDVTTARNALAKAETSLKVLSEYTNEMEMTSRRNAVLQAEQRVNRVRRENASNLSWRTADLAAKEQNLTVLRRRHERLKEQFAACTVLAPAEGMVIYGSSSDRNSQTPIQEGTQVRERQLLVRLPDTSAMKAVVRIHESVVSRLSDGQPATVRIVGHPTPLAAKVTKISVLADNSQRWWNPDLREYPVDVALDETPEGLKPGIGASVDIVVDRVVGVTAVPLDAVYTVGNERFVFVREGEGARPVKVQVGVNNDAFVQITEGVDVGTSVLRLQAGQGRELLEKAGIKVAPATRPGR